MATLNQLASIVQNGINGGIGVANERITLEQIKDELVFTLHRIVSEQKKQGVFDAKALNMMYQRIDCLEVVCKPLTECCQGVKSSKKVLYARIPKFSHIRYIGGISFEATFVLSYAPSLNAIGHSRFTKNKPTAWIRQSNELILLNPPTFDFKYISIEGLLEDFREIYNFECSPCKSDDDDIPYPSEYADMATGKLIASYLNYGQKPAMQPNTQADIT